MGWQSRDPLKAKKGAGMALSFGVSSFKRISRLLLLIVYCRARTERRRRPVLGTFVAARINILFDNYHVALRLDYANRWCYLMEAFD